LPDGLIFARPHRHGEVLAQADERPPAQNQAEPPDTVPNGNSHTPAMPAAGNIARPIGHSRIAPKNSQLSEGCEHSGIVTPNTPHATVGTHAHADERTPEEPMIPSVAIARRRVKRLVTGPMVRRKVECVDVRQKLRQSATAGDAANRDDGSAFFYRALVRATFCREEHVEEPPAAVFDVEDFGCPSRIYCDGSDTDFASADHDQYPPMPDGGLDDAL
jgi:hypothetical protein